MKLSVVCSDERLDLLPRLRSVLDNLYIEYLAWYPRSGIEPPESLDLLERCLDYSPYVLCIPAGRDASSSWLHYTFGYQRGRTDRLTFWVAPEDSRSIPDWLARFVVITGDEKDVYRYFAEVEATWSEETSARMARKAVIDRNLEFSARTFIESVISGDRLLMGQFLEAGFSPSLRDAAGVPVLNHAIRSGHAELVRPLLEAGADLNGVAEDRGTTPLMEASAAGMDDMTVRLIGMGADLEIASRDGQTAVILAVGNGREESAVALIRAGADADVQDMLGMSARKYATLYGQKDILDAIAAIPEGSAGPSN